MSKDPGSRHLTTSAAVDAGRGVIGVTGADAQAAHVANCDVCREKVRRWTGFADTARRIASVEPPEDVVARAKALAAGRPRVTALTRLKAALHYQSAWSPLPAGVRGPSGQGQVVFQAAEFAVEVRVTHDRKGQVAIVGQVTNVHEPAKRLGGVPVTLLEGERVAARGTSNAWGEFHFEHEDPEGMWLEVTPEEGRVIRVPVRPKSRTS